MSFEKTTRSTGADTCAEHDQDDADMDDLIIGYMDNDVDDDDDPLQHYGSPLQLRASSVKMPLSVNHISSGACACVGCVFLFTA